MMRRRPNGLTFRRDARVAIVSRMGGKALVMDLTRIPGAGQGNGWAEQEALDDLKRIKSYIPAKYWAVFENVCRFDETAGFAGSALTDCRNDQVATARVTEGSATSGITDYSRRETDEFGETMIVPRAWAKRMAGKALIRTDAVDQVVGRIAAVRAVPSLWLGDAGLDSLIVYGFFKDFSVEVGETLSKLTLSIEGFSEAKTPAPLTIPWENVSGTKPTENADNTAENTSKDTGAVAGVPAKQVIADAVSVKQRSDILENITIPAINSAVAAANALIRTAEAKADAALADLNAKLLASGIVLDAALANADSKLVEARVTADLAVSRANNRIDAAMTDLNAEAKTWVPYSAGNDRTVTASTRALVSSTATTLADADSAIGRRIDTITTDYVGRDSATNARVDQTASALSEGDRALGIRVDGVVASLATTDSAVRAEIGRVERTSVDRDTALGQRSDTITASLNDARGRLSTVEMAVTDGRFAAAQRVSNLEAQVGADLSARIDQRATAIVDPKIGVVTQSVTDLRSAYNGTVATVQQQAGTLVDLAGKATAYVRLLADGGNGVARLSLWSDQFGGAWELIGDGRIGGNLVVDGTITSTKMGASSVQQAMFLTLPGSMSIPYG
jgi:hypothetical protein